MDPEQPHSQLLRDHEEIEALLQDLLAAFETGERSVASRAFQAFERRLSAHLALEDEMLLPALAASSPREAEEIAAEHRSIRARLEEIAVENNLHVSRATEVRRFVQMLRAHAQHEERALYPLADRLANQSALRHRLDWLRGGARARHTPPAV
jgi:hemerythrin-like domain-containing protein